MHPFVSIFGRNISVYGLISIFGYIAACAYVMLSSRSRKAGYIPQADITNIAASAVIGIMIGGKLLGFVVNLPAVLRNLSKLGGFIQIILSLFGAFVFYGGLIGGIVAVFLYCRKYAIPLEDTAGLFVPAIPFFHSFARIGCFMAGCCYGIEYEGGIAFTHSIAAPNGVELLPVQLIESIFNMLLFLVLAVVARRIGDKLSLLPIYFLSYGTFRFLIEFYRGDAVRGIWPSEQFGLSTSQWISIVLILWSVVWFLRRKRREPQTA